jgi:hypothetical protein
MRRILLISASFLLLTGSPRAQTNPASLPAHDRHEGLLVAADPYTDAARAKERFGKANPLEAGVVAIEVFLRNETDDPMRIDLETVRLDIAAPGGDHQRLDWMDAEHVALLIAHPGGVAQPQAKRRLPMGIPLPGKDKKTSKLAEILQPLTLDADVIGAHATIHGFLFFNLNRDYSLLEHATLYLPDVKRIRGNQPLMFFEVSLRAAVRP